MPPLAFFSYGMTKCGTTLAFELTRTALLEAGIAQESIPFTGDAPRRINFIPDLTEKRAADIRRAREGVSAPVVIKTHGRPSPTMVTWVETGEGTGHAIFRDLRDMALSMLDAGRHAREAGRPAFSEIHTLEDACTGIANQLDSLSAWLQLPGIRPLQYERFASDTETGAAEILTQLGLAGNPRRIARKVARADKTLRNKAIPERHRQELSAAESRAIQSRFAPFYDILFDKPDVALPLPPGTDFKAPQNVEL
ncbi:MAG: hypothetical protein AAFY59_09700 [Pseudomonadota bacterium]